MTNNNLTKCNFCRYFNGSSCLATPNTKYCQEALNEYLQYRKTKGYVVTPVKSFRPWDKRK